MNHLLELGLIALGAFVAGAWLAASGAQRVIAGNRIDEDRLPHAEDDYPGPRRSLHFTRQDVAGVFTALTFANGFLAAILAILVFRG